ncbi:activator-dependent family glycosyltransferase [Streptomyces flavofungini]|uniref:activator-dependent family glycosyltransferase n=1 Tax=Streptomyces flavofungini TaxID=68200 RepID=UPI0025B04B31|nr:activator-dependent family glycosyltransferase [Streptomyces flavofungini]WJV44452.1 activator-dependent family glycosyltransferase [Streptomyces flavofungini]
MTMRILFTAYAVRTHFFSMVSLAHALDTAGHEVRVASQPELVPEITRAGLTAVPVGRDHQLWRVLKARHGDERWSALPPFDVADVPGELLSLEYLRAGYADVVPWWFRLVNEPLVDELVGFCRWWEPDLVVWEPGTFAGGVAARVCGAAHGRLTWGVDFFGRVREQFVRLAGEAGEPAGGAGDALGAWLGELGRRHGVGYDEELTTGQFTVDQLPEAFRLDTAGIRYLPMRFGVYNGVSVVPRWLWEVPVRPRVGFTLGLSAVERLAGYSVSVVEILRALAALDVEVVAALPGAGEIREELGGVVGERVRVEEFVPLAALAPTCAVMVHHGGFGTIGTTSLHAVPQLAVAEEIDAPILARGLAAYGAGIDLPVAEATGERVAHEVRRLLTESSFTEGARRLRADMRAMPSAADVVPDLVRIAERHRGR